MPMQPYTPPPLTLYSLKNRFFRLLMIPLGSALMLIGAIAYGSVYHEANEIYDAQLAHFAQTISSLLRNEIIDDSGKALTLSLDQDTIFHGDAKKLSYRVWYHDHAVIVSQTAAQFTDSATQTGYQDVIVATKHWRSYTLVNAASGIKVEVSERREVRREIIINLMLSLFMPVLCAVPFIILLLWLVARKGFAPITVLSEDVGRRSAEDLSPLTPSDIPQEVAAIVEAINGLMQRLEHSLAAEKQFTDNAAHELRTPLAVLKTQVQTLLSVQDEAMRTTLLKDLEKGITRATKMVEQLLTLARLEHNQQPFQPVVLSILVQNTMADLVPLALQKNVTVTADIAPDITIDADAAALEIVLRNLLDNSIKYTPSGGAMHLCLYRDHQHVVIHLDDTGPGIVAEERSAVFQRFYRLKRETAQGSGLGLSIAQTITQRHHAELVLEDNPAGEGLRVTLRFG